jgi:hypothetical protein
VRCSYAAWRALQPFGKLGLASLDTDKKLNRLGHTCGELLNLLVGLALLPVARGLDAVGVPRERGVRYHRGLGGCVVVVGVLHVSFEHADWAVQGVYFANLFNYVGTHTGQVHGCSLLLHTSPSHLSFTPLLHTSPAHPFARLLRTSPPPLSFPPRRMCGRGPCR